MLHSKISGAASVLLGVVGVLLFTGAPVGGQLLPSDRPLALGLTAQRSDLVDRLGIEAWSDPSTPLYFGLRISNLDPADFRSPDGATFLVQAGWEFTWILPRGREAVEVGYHFSQGFRYGEGEAFRWPRTYSLPVLYRAQIPVLGDESTGILLTGAVGGMHQTIGATGRLEWLYGGAIEGRWEHLWLRAGSDAAHGPFLFERSGYLSLGWLW